jgi:hypothetical protein
MVHGVQDTDFLHTANERVRSTTGGVGKGCGKLSAAKGYFAAGNGNSAMPSWAALAEASGSA